MEEVFLAQGLDLVVDGVQQRLVAFADGRGDGILAAQRGNTDGVAGILLCEGDDLGVIVGPGHAAVLKGALGGGVGIVLLQRNVGVVLGQIGLGGGAGNDDHLVIGIPVVQRGDDAGIRGDNAQRDVHVGQRKIHFLGTLRRDGEVCQDDVHLACLQVLNAVGGLGGDVVDLDAEVLGQAVAEVDVVALILAVLINVAERVLVGENADVDGTVGLDLVQRAVDNAVSGCGGGRIGAGAAAAGGQGQAEGRGQCRSGHFGKLFHDGTLLLTFIYFPLCAAW